MTREEQRAKALYEMRIGYWHRYDKPGGCNDIGELMEAVLDALGATGFHVIGPEVTDEILDAADGIPISDHAAVFLSMAAAADLTRKP